MRQTVYIVLSLAFAAVLAAAPREEAPIEIFLVLDRSGSMEPTRADTVGAFNAFLADRQAGIEGKLKWPAPDVRLTLILFADTAEILHDSVPIAEVPPLEVAAYVPRGNTALLDAWDLALDLAADAACGCGGPRIVFAVLTDGEENASTTATRDEVFRRMARFERRKGWTSVYLGANQDAVTVAQSYGMAGTISLTADTDTADITLLGDDISDTSLTLDWTNSTAADALEVLSDVVDVVVESESPDDKQP